MIRVNFSHNHMFIWTFIWCLPTHCKCQVRKTWEDAFGAKDNLSNKKELARKQWGFTRVQLARTKSRVSTGGKDCEGHWAIVKRVEGFKGTQSRKKITLQECSSRFWLVQPILLSLYRWVTNALWKGRLLIQFLIAWFMILSSCAMCQNWSNW